MKDSEGVNGINMDFLSTHPANERRIQQIKRWLPEASFVTTFIKAALKYIPFQVQELRAASCGGMADQSQAFQSSFGSFFR